MAHLSGKDAKRSTDVLAKTEVTLIEVDPEVLLLSTSNCRYQFAEAFLRMLVKRLAVANTRITRLLNDNGEDQ
jgi:CRP-like cAMP-binding protein